MIALLLQTLLLMSAAFFIGAALACGLRRLFNSDRDAETVPAAQSPRAKVPPAPVDPLPQYAARATPAAQPAAPQVTPPIASPVAPRAQPAPSVQPAPAAATLSRFDNALKTRLVEPPRIDPKELLDRAGLVMIETDRSKAPVQPQPEEPVHLGRPRRERPKPQEDDELKQVETKR